MPNKTLIFDLETFPNISYHWHGKHEQDIIEIIDEGYILCFAYKWQGEKKVKWYGLCDFNGDKKKLVEKLHELFNEADHIIAHNGTSFDFKWANTAFITYGLTPPKPTKNIDTLQIARSKFYFNSNRLNDLGKLLGLGIKVETGGFELWKKCALNDKKAWNTMRKYNCQDVNLLEKVYDKLSSWAKTPKINLGMTCNNCGSTHLQRRGWSINKVYMSRRIQCVDCGHWMLSSKKVKHENLEYTK